MQTGYSTHSQKKSIYSISNTHPKIAMQKPPQDLRLQQCVRFTSALKYIPSDAGADRSCGISLLLPYALIWRTKSVDALGRKSWSRWGQAAPALPHENTHTPYRALSSGVLTRGSHSYSRLRRNREKEKRLRNWPVFRFHPPAAACPQCSSWPEGTPSFEPFLSKSSQRPRTNLRWQKGLHWPQAVRKKEK